jgi:hypothetical protein
VSSRASQETQQDHSSEGRRRDFSQWGFIYLGAGTEDPSQHAPSSSTAVCAPPSSPYLIARQPWLRPSTW